MMSCCIHHFQHFKRLSSFFFLKLLLRHVLRDFVLQVKTQTDLNNNNYKPNQTKPLLAHITGCPETERPWVPHSPAGWKLLSPGLAYLMVVK